MATLENMRAALLAALLAAVVSQPALAQRRARPAGAKNQALKRQGQSLNVRRQSADAVGAEPVFSVDWTQALSGDGTWISPVTLTASIRSGIDVAVNFDAFERVPGEGDAGPTAPPLVWQPTSYWTFAAELDLCRAGPVQFEFLPQLTIPRGDGDSGILAGGTLLGRGRRGRTDLGSWLNWIGATRPSDDTPAGVWETGASAARQFGRFRAHGNASVERATSAAAAVATQAGLTVELGRPWRVDVTSQLRGIGSGERRHSLLFTLSWRQMRRRSHSI